MSSTIYLEGGGDSRDLQIRCREGFRKLLEWCGYAGRLPKLVACGGRGRAFADFKTALASARKGDFLLSGSTARIRWPTSKPPGRI